MRVLSLALCSWVAQALQPAKKVVAKKELPTLASSLAALSHRVIRQEPAAEAPPAEGGSAPAEGEGATVDKEAYEKDWGTEHRSEPWPESTRGLQHHPSYNSTTRIEAFFGLAWYYLLAIVLAVGGAVFYYFKR